MREPPATNKGVLREQVSPVLEAFCEYLTVARGMSLHTVEAYRRDVTAFFSEVNKAAEVVTPDDIEQWLAKSAKHIKASTQARRLASLKTFFKFMLMRGWRQDHPAAAVARPKQGVPLPSALSEQEVDALLAAPLGESPSEVRLRLMIQLLYACGMRVSELTNLTLADVAEGEGVVLRVTGKGEKVRLVPLGTVASETLRHYIATARRELPGANSNYVFASPRGGVKGVPLSRQRVFQLIQEAGKRVGLTLHPHQLRHTFATHLVNHDADLRSVQVMLGHASLNTTQIYTKVARQRAAEVLERFHPLNKGLKTEKSG